ncbi:MAG: outer membrane beta-barrel protein [Flavobacteriales bacterium]
MIRLGHSLRSLLTGLVLINGFLAWSQPPARGGRPGGMPAIGRVYGRVLDATTNKGAEFATVTVYRMPQDSVVGGDMVRANGDFAVEKLPVGPLRVVVSFLGYDSQERQVSLSREKPELDLGNITIDIAPAGQLAEAEVVGEKQTMVMRVDRRVFYVDKDISTQGGTGVDVMKNVPGLSVDVDGNVQMRGSTPQILVDGRPTSMSLDQIPAEEIERVEVITNPSVAFDASTTGGILNVILKKNTKPGYYGQLQGGIGTNDRYQAGLNLNVKEGRWGFNASYNYNTGRNATLGFTQRTDLADGANIGYYEQDTKSNSGRTMHGGRFGVDWQVNNRSMITLSQNFRLQDMDGDDHLAFTNYGAGHEVLSSGDQINTSISENNNLTSQIGFRHKAPKEGREWNVDLTYNWATRDSRSDLDLYTYNTDGSAAEGSPRLQDNIGGSDWQSFTMQADFVEPVSDRTRFEWGVKANWRPDHTWLNVFVTSPTLGTDVVDSALTNDYQIDDVVNAAYVNWSQQLSDRWSLMAGFRFEQTWFETELVGKDQKYSYKYPDGLENLDKALFPALFFVRRWDNSLRELQVNFSRKIERPRFYQIMPFIMFSDSRNLRIGNPTLAPELSDLAEVNHLLPFLGGKATWFTSAFGRYTRDVITSYATPLPTDTSITLLTFVNGSYSATGGWENILKFDPVQGLQVTLSGTLQYTDIALGSAQGGARNTGTSWNAKAMINYRFSKDWTAQLNGEYESPRPQPQGTGIRQYGVDASVSHDLAKKLTAVLSVNDVFNSRRWGNIIDTPYLYQENARQREARYVRFTLTWKFGEQNTSLFRKKNQQRSDPGSGGDSDF